MKRSDDMATAKSDTDDAGKKIARLEIRVGELERSLRDEQARRERAEAKYEGYSMAVRDLGRRENNGPEPGMFPYPFSMMFRRP